MNQCLLLSMLLALGCVRVQGAPAPDALEPASCKDAQALGAAEQALNKINKDRKEGYVFALDSLANAHIKSHEESGHIFYLTLDVVETNCSVVSGKQYKECEVRPDHNTPVYGQCKVIIYISRIHRVVHLYSYNCVVRPVPSSKLVTLCPDCPSLMSLDSDNVKTTVSTTLDKFNKDSGLANHFALLNVSRATAGMALGMYYAVEFTIQETTCAQGTAEADKCPLMDCEFAHKGFCKGSMYPTPTGEESYNVECEIYEPEAAKKELTLHQSDNTDHVHGDLGQVATQAEATAQGQHAHHWHVHTHDGVHAHHDKAHDHTGDVANKHHDYKHADGEHHHEHDHEIALDHDHKHAHLHTHEHHHHHHHVHGTPVAPAHDPEGLWNLLPSVDHASPLAAFPDMPAITGSGPQLPPGAQPPALLPFPTELSAECPVVPPGEGSSLVQKMFAEDPMFKTA